MTDADEQASRRDDLPVDWDARYRTEDTPWERGEPAPPLVEYLEGRTLSGQALVPGCGLGNDARYLAARGCSVVGVDISPIAIQKAQAQPLPLGADVSFQLCDFLDPQNGLPREAFDLVFEHTCFCAIDPLRRQDYAAAIHRHLKPGGQLLAILFTDLDDEDGPPYPVLHHEVEAHFSPRFSIERHWRPSRCFPGREGEETVYLMKRKACQPEKEQTRASP